MRRPLRPIAIGACFLAPVLLEAQPCPGRTPGDSVPTRSSLTIEDPYLAARVRGLELRAPPLRVALDSVRSGCVPVRLGTAAGIAGSMRWLSARLHQDELGQTAADVDTSTQTVREVIVRVDLEAVARHLRGQVPPLDTWLSRPRRQARFDALVDAVLIHELWAHLVPLAIGGSVRFLCPDPLPGQPDLESCSVLRENELRVRLGLAPRAQYSIDAAW